MATSRKAHNKHTSELANRSLRTISLARGMSEVSGEVVCFQSHPGGIKGFACEACLGAAAYTMHACAELDR